MSPDDLKVRFDALLKEYDETIAACRAAQCKGLTGAEEYRRAQTLLREVEMAGKELAAALEGALDDTNRAEG